MNDYEEESDYDDDYDDEDGYAPPAKPTPKKLIPTLPESEADPRFTVLAKLLAGDHSPEDAVAIAGFPADEMEPKDIVALCTMPIVTKLQEDIAASNVPIYAITKEQTLAHLRGIVETPLSAITETSPFCQSVQYHWKTGTVTKVTSVDKLKALDMSNKLQGFYAPDKLEIDPGDSMLDLISQTRAKNSNRDKLDDE